MFLKNIQRSLCDESIQHTSWYLSEKNFSFTSHRWPHSIQSQDHHLNAEWGMTTAGRCSATATGTHRCRSRWHQFDNGHRRSSSHTRNGTCWSGYGRSLHWGRGQKHIHPAPAHTCQNNQHYRCKVSYTVDSFIGCMCPAQN